MAKIESNQNQGYRYAVNGAKDVVRWNDNQFARIAKIEMAKIEGLLCAETISAIVVNLIYLRIFSQWKS